VRFSFKRIIQVGLVAVTLTLGLVAANPAEARTVSACPGTTNTCGWILNEFTGDPGFINTMPNTFGACVNVTGFSNNNIESVLNENPFQVSFYDGTNGSGYMFSLAAGAGEGNLAIHPGSGGFQNRISSVCHE
jgi:hypothetical protein